MGFAKMNALTVWYEHKRISSDRKKDSFIVEDYTTGRRLGQLDFESFGSNLRNLSSFNAAAVGLVFYGMIHKQDIRFRGLVSKRLLENLEEFQAAWGKWRPAWSRIGLSADVEGSTDTIRETEDAICTFSGGVDATFSLWRHHFKKEGRHHKTIKSAVMVQGFDIAGGDETGMQAALRSARNMLDPLGIELYRVRTNLKDKWLPDWNMNFGAGCATVLHLFSHGHSFGIIGGDEPYDRLITPWGSNPITNHLLSSQVFKILYDGNGFSRTEKIERLVSWPEAVNNLRVCWEGNTPGKNCGSCEKCRRTKLNFLAVGIDQPGCFAEPIQAEDVRTIKISNHAVRTMYEEILEAAERRKISAPWVTEVRQLLQRSIRG
ncbi:hypothetical protein [Microvirga arabica]|uniref:hypothetical protein n=1 Tax=Microvirga arabica TaxID=1128671 RepID=UPI001939B916|nr:hypothetical protein [Microvirga arabica]MBM1171284.1 hypothetical protein [Microvirga arabica]